jgi:hypothetical protein
MASYCLAFLWGLVILASFVGWGGAVNRVLFPAQRVDWGQRAAWGVALSVVVGGVLNLRQVISRTAVLVYLGLGIVSWLVGWIPRIRDLSQAKRFFQTPPDVKYRKLFACGIFLVAALITMQYAASISGVQHEGAITATMFNPADDFQAYFVFPEKMLQTGSMGPDPFSGRRLESSLGGKSFLDTFVLSMLSFGNLHLLDPGIGLLIIVGLLLGRFDEKNTPGWGRLGILFFLVLIPPATGNITSLYIALALFLSLYRTLVWEGLQSARFFSRVLVVAVLAAAICSLKSTFIPVCGIFLTCSFLCYPIARGKWRTTVVEMTTTAVFVIVLTLPWMIAMRASSGTLLYPILGKGYHQSAYGNSASPYSDLTISKAATVLKNISDASSVVLFALGIIYLVTRKWRSSAGGVPLFLLAGAFLGKIALTVATGGSHTYRYSFPFVMAATIVLLTELVSGALSSEEAKSRSSERAAFAAWVAAVFLVGFFWDGSRLAYIDYVRNVRQRMRDSSLVSAEETDGYRKLQESIPRGEICLARLDKAFLLDFRQNRVFVMDQPGESSVPPGMPLFSGSEALAGYLLSKSIRYVAYSYGDEAGFAKALSYRLSPYFDPWDRRRAEHTFDVQDNLAELGKTRALIFDDGKNFVLDLQKDEQNKR